MNKKSFSACPRLWRGVIFYVFICLLGCILTGGGFSIAQAASQVTLSWRANPQSDNVLGYRLYFGATSRLDSSGFQKSGFLYTYYLDFTDSQRCVVAGAEPVCETYTDDVSCEGLYGETPRCTLYNIQGWTYFAMTAYNAQAESSYTDELSGYYRSSADPLTLSEVASVLQPVHSLLLN